MQRLLALAERWSYTDINIDIDTDICMNSVGIIYIKSKGEARVQKFDHIATGTHLQKLNTKSMTLEIYHIVLHLLPYSVRT